MNLFAKVTGLTNNIVPLIGVSARKMLIWVVLQAIASYVLSSLEDLLYNCVHLLQG